MPEDRNSCVNSSRPDVAAEAVGQLARPVPADSARDVALVVCVGVDVDLDEADVRVVEVLLGPGRIDEGGARGIRADHRSYLPVGGAFGGRRVSSAGTAGGFRAGL